MIKMPSKKYLCLGILLITVLVAGGCLLVGLRRGWWLGAFPEALRTGDVETIRKWLEHRPELANQPICLGERHGTPLQVAIAFNHLEITQLLLDYGADPNGSDMVGNMPLHEAANSYHGHSRQLVARSHQEMVADIMADVLISPKIAKLVLERGGQVNGRNGSQRTPLHLAAWSLNLPVVEVLLAHGADGNASDQFGHTPLSWFLKATKKDYYPDAPRLVERLLENGALVNAPDLDGNTPLHLALSRFPPAEKIVPVLLAHGADVGLRNKLGQLPIEVLSREVSSATRVALEKAWDRSVANVPSGQRTVAFHLVSRQSSQVNGEIYGAYFNVSPEPAQAGEPITIRFRLVNRGTQPTSRCCIHFYLAPQLPIRTTNFHLGQVEHDALSAGELSLLATHTITLPPIGHAVWKGNQVYYIGMSLTGPGEDQLLLPSTDLGDRLNGLWQTFEDVYIKATPRNK